VRGEITNPPVREVVTEIVSGHPQNAKPGDKILAEKVL
jgi:hypothetical protein